MSARFLPHLLAAAVLAVAVAGCQRGPQAEHDPARTVANAGESGALVATLDLARAARHRAGMGFFRDRRPQLYGRICEDI